MIANIQRKTFTTEEYQRMAETGILKEEDRVELINGEIISMAAIGSFHAACVNRLNQLFTRAFRDSAVTAIQNPVTISKTSEPEPDLALLKPRPDFYAANHPTPEDVYLIIEVADTSVEYDRGFKLPLYARAAIKEVWIVDLHKACIEAHSNPSERGYRMIRKFYRGDVIAPPSFPEKVFPVNEILG